MNASPDAPHRPDHRRLGRDLDLFSLQEEVGAGLVLWHPRGALVRKLMEDWWRDAHLARGYGFVVSPHVGRGELWARSGHLGFYRDSMFPPMALERGEAFCKPMNCPFHMQIFLARPRRLRELPLRFAELGAVYRHEASGALHGLLRVRGFVQDDAHLFCAPEQAEGEVADALAFALELLSAFGFDDVEVQLSNRPRDFVGAPEAWDAAVASLDRAARLVGREPVVNEGGGAFYGPKLDVQVRDAHGRAWQCSSVQYDFNLPERFDLSFLDAAGVARRPVVIHRALFGSLERFFALLLEHHGGALPGWLSPEQVRLLPVDAAAAPWAHEVCRALVERGLRAAVEAGDENLGRRIRAAEALHVPFIAVIGAREVEGRSVSLRARGRVLLGERALPAALDELSAALARPSHRPRR